jgi:hypothetical protein
MNIDEFFRVLDEDIKNNKESFKKNVKYGSFAEDMTFCSWIEMFSAWMEWLEGDCEESHIQYEQD